MRFLLVTIFVHSLITLGSGQAVFQINPQVGVNVTGLTGEPSNQIVTEGKVGYLLGADMRLGRTAFFQPGLFLNSSRTVYSFLDSVFTGETEVNQHSLKLKALVGAKLINSDNLKLRLAAGPTYDFQLNLDDEDNPVVNDDNIRDGKWNASVAAGIDLLIFTAEIGYSFGLSEVFEEQSFPNQPKYQTFHFTVGIVIGG